MTEYKKIFLDTTPIIYFLDADINYAEKVEKAAQIRARYKDFKTMDCLQLATACLQQCDLFLTNDKQLCQFDGLKCMVIDDFK